MAIVLRHIMSCADSGSGRLPYIRHQRKQMLRPHTAAVVSSSSAYGLCNANLHQHTRRCANVLVSEPKAIKHAPFICVPV